MKVKYKLLGAVCALGIATGCGSADLGGAPDVRGINLEDADARLKTAGYVSTIVEDDAVFGVVLRDSFTVCEQDTPKGKTVPLHVAKRGC